MKKVVLAFLVSGLFFTSVSCANNTGQGTDLKKDDQTSDSGVILLTKEAFIEKVFDYENNKEWKYNGDKPAIVDFYADWCGPCKMLSPVLEELQKDYKGEIQVYKVNTDKERELAATFGIRSLPTIVFIPKDGQPQAVMGFRPKAELEQVVAEILKVNRP